METHWCAILIIILYVDLPNGLRYSKKWTNIFPEEACDPFQYKDRLSKYMGSLYNNKVILHSFNSNLGLLHLTQQDACKRPV